MASGQNFRNRTCPSTVQCDRPVSESDTLCWLNWFSILLVIWIGPNLLNLRVIEQDFCSPGQGFVCLVNLLVCRIKFFCLHDQVVCLHGQVFCLLDHVFLFTRSSFFDRANKFFFCTIKFFVCTIKFFVYTSQVFVYTIKYFVCTIKFLSAWSSFFTWRRIFYFHGKDFLQQLSLFSRQVMTFNKFWPK